jgi:uncharacterized membrane protein
VTKSRLEAFADGVFAIAATLLILNVTVSGAPLAHELVQIWPSYAAYVVSFITIGIIWVNHHTVLGQIGKVDRLFLFLNVLFLMMVAFIPFPTRLLAVYINTPEALPASLAFGLTLTITAIFFNLLWRYAAAGRRLLRDDADQQLVDGIGRSYLPGPFIYFAATLVGFASPLASAGLYAAIAAFYVLESSLFGRK